jgi:hypothetical protein
MKCNDVKSLIPDILHAPGQHPEAEAHIRQCDDCKEELSLLRYLHAGMKQAFPAPSPFDSVLERVRLLRRIRRESRRLPLIYATALAAVLLLTLLFAPIFPDYEDPREVYAQQETKAVDFYAGSQISDEEILMYLIEHEGIDVLQELSLEL